ncbi:MAG: 1-acyl-sn-glycerol-3-phosphate acyltransferase [Pseudomonadota bacterium]|nr:1-acyl-sn-glycerol-3-phosphate acyltransferase [Pseudomonadota bacterium]
MIGHVLGKTFFKATGWTYEVAPDALSDPKQVIIGFPHTTNMDTVRAMAFFNILQLPYHILVKQELFKPVFGEVLRGLGCIPVDRQNSKNIVQHMVDEFAQHERFSLAVAPEATRGKDGEKRPIRTGFWHIAKAAHVPIVLLMTDNVRHKGLVLGKIYPSDDMQADLRLIQAAYAKQGIHVELPPDKASTPSN